MANAHIQTALNRFFDASKFAVVGASKDPSKFGNKVGTYTSWLWADPADHLCSQMYLDDHNECRY